MKEKEENEAGWKTKNGFDTLNKNMNWNKHPKQPPQSVMDDLNIPYVQQKHDAKTKLKSAVYRPEDYGKQDFQSKVKQQHQQGTFSDPSFFKTVFISGEDMVKEMEADRQKEKDDFQKKVVVDN